MQKWRPTLLVLTSTYPRWVNDYEPGFVHELCRRLLDRFRVVVVTSHAPGAAVAEWLDGVEVIRYRYAPGALETLVYGGGMVAHIKRAPWKLALLPGFLLGQYLLARKVMRQRKVDIIHAHWLLPQGMVARWLARATNTPFVVTAHGGDLFGLRGTCLTACKRAVVSACAAMTVVSDAMRGEVKRLKWRPSRLEVLPMGVDMQQRFTVDEKVPRSAAELLFVGRLVPKKGLGHLLQAMPAIHAKHPAVQLMIAGFGPEAATLKAAVAQLGLPQQVTFLGAVTQQQLPELYRRAALLVAPFLQQPDGDQEGMAVVLMEALACGCPVMAGDVAGARELLGEFAPWLCVDASHPGALAAAIIHALDHPQAVRDQAMQLRSHVAQRLDWQSIAVAYQQLLLDCLPVW